MDRLPLDQLKWISCAVKDVSLKYLKLVHNHLNFWSPVSEKWLESPSFLNVTELLGASFVHTIWQIDANSFLRRIKILSAGSTRVWPHTCKRHLDPLTNNVVVWAAISLNGRTVLVVPANLNESRFIDEILPPMLYCKIRLTIPSRSTKCEHNDATLIRRNVCWDSRVKETTHLFSFANI